MNLRLVIVLSLSLALIITSLAGAAVVQPTDDSSGNEHNLTIHGDPQPGAVSDMPKFGEGFTFDGTGGGDQLTAADPDPLATNGDFSLMAAYSAEQQDIAGTVFFAGSATFPDYSVSAGVTFVQLVYQGTTNQQIVDCTFSEQGNVSFWIVRNNGALDANIRMKAFNETGTLLCDVTETTELPAVSDDNFFALGAIEGPQREFLGDIYEARVWLTDVPEPTLDGIADPTVGSAREAEGTEEGLWYLERSQEPEEPTSHNYVMVHGPEQADAGTQVTLYAEGYNTQGGRVQPTNNPTMFLQRVRVGAVADLTFFWNTTTESFQTSPHPINMTPVTGGGNETLFNATFNLPSEGGPLTANVVMEIEIPPTGEQEDPVPTNFTGDHTLQVSDTMTFELTMAEMTQKQTIEFLFWSIPFLFFLKNGWLLPSFGALTGLMNPVWEPFIGTGAWPVNFPTAVLVTILALYIHGWANDWAWADRETQERQALRAAELTERRSRG